MAGVTLGPAMTCSSATRCTANVEPTALAELIRSLLADGLAVEVEVSGSSMWPFVRSGDVIMLEPRKPRVGDIGAMLDSERRLLVHRVVAGSGGIWVTRGDAAGSADPPTREADVVGRVAAVVRDGHPVRTSVSAGRRILAGLSRIGLLAPLMRRLARLEPLERPDAR